MIAVAVSGSTVLAQANPWWSASRSPVDLALVELTEVVAVGA